MKKLKLFFACLLMAVLSIGQVWATLPTSPTWEAQALADIADGSTIIIISNSTQATNVALPAAGAGSSNPPKKACTVTTTAGVTTITPPDGTTLQDLAWTIKKKTSTWQFFVEGSTTNCLYLTGLSSNTALRVGAGTSNNEFTMGSDGKLLKVSTGTRFVGPNDNNGTDWRTYNSETGTNYKGAVLTFYVLKVGEETACATPSFTPAAGAVLSGTTVTLSTTTEDADIYYTMGDAPADPTSGSTKYSAPITITEATTIKAIAVKAGLDNSGVATASYTIATPLTTMQAIFEAATAAGSTATPTYITFSSSWVVTGVATNGKNVYITDGTNGMILFNNSGNMGLAVGNTLSGTVQRSLKLYNGAAELDGFTTDGLTIGTADLPNVHALDADGIEALSGVNTGSLIKISGACTQESSKYYVAGVQLYNSLFAYTNPTAGNDYNVTGVYVQYNSTKEILPRSAADIEEVTASGAPETPTFSVAAGEYTAVQTVELSCATDGATIYYTTDGSTPSAGSTEYTAAITVDATMTIKAIAVKDELSSAIASATYTINIPLPSHDFQVTHHFSTGEGFEFPTGWGGSYAEHEIAYTDDKVHFVSASHQSGTITDRPVTKNQAISLILTNSHKLISAVRFDYAQWGTKAQTLTMKYSTDGGENYSDFDPVVSSTDFALQVLTMPAGVNAIQVTGANSSNQVGLTSIAFDLEDKVVVTKTVTITTPSNGTLVVKNAGVAISSGDPIEVGTTLTIEATPASGYLLSAVSVVDEDEDPVSISEGAFVVPSKNVTVSATFIENVKPDATLTLSEIGVTHDITGNKQDDVINLPLTATSCSKTFVGWDPASDCDHAPTYAPGASYTLANTTQTLYAVYADAAAGSSWEVATSVTAGDVVVISTNTGYTANPMKTAGAISSSIFGATASTYGSENAQITELAEGTMEFTIGGNATDGWTLMNGTKYLKVTAAKKVNLVDDEETWTINFSGNNATLAPKTGDYTGYSIQYNYNTGNDRFTAYNTTQVAISLYKQVASYSNYSTDCQAAVATPTFSPAAGTYTEAQTVTISCATEEATIYYTTDGSTPTNESTEYTAAISVDENMTIKAIAVKAGMANSAVASATYTINLPLSTMDQIFAAATAAGSTATDVNITFGNWVVSGVSTNAKNVFVTDGTKGLIIFDSGASMGFAAGDVLSGTVACKVQLYKGAAELTTLSSETEGLNIATGGSVTPQVKAISELSGINTGAPVTINSVQFDGEFLTDGVNSIKPFNSLFAYGALENGKYYNVTGIYQQFDATKEILPRSAADIEELTLDDPELSYSPASQEIEVGDAWSAPTLSNEHGLTLSYESSNPALATVSDAGVIALVENATGTATITASFAGDGTYAAGSATYTITVNSAGTSQNVVILAVYDTKYYAMSTTNASSAFTAIAVEYDGEKVTVNSADDKAAIQWTKKTSGDNTTFQDADSKYMKSADGTSMSLQDAVCNWIWDEGGFYKISGTSRTFFYQNGTGFKNFATSNFNKSGYSDKAQVIVIDPANIVITSKADPQLAYDPTSVTLTVGGAFTPATLTYAEGFDGLASVTYASNNEDVATVDESGVVSLVADAIGTATITATFAGNNNYLAGSASYTITVNEAGDDLSGTWVLASSVAAGDEIIIMGANNADIYTMGKQNTNNRAAVASTLSEDVLNPGAATKVFTLVDAGEGKFAIQASNGNYLTSATSGTSNNLLEAADYELDNAKWTITIDGEGVASVVAAAGSKTVMQYNSGSTIFSCYGSATQKPVKIFKRDAAPAPVYETVRSGLTAGNYYTICYPKAMTDVQGATLWSFVGKDTEFAYIEQETATTIEAGKPYIMYATASTVTAVLGDETNAPDANGALHGTFELMNQSALDGAGDNIYLVIGNVLRRVDGQTDNTLPAYRAYVDLDEIDPISTPNPAPGKNVRRMPMQKDQAQGFESVEASEKPMKLMIDGKMYILRGEKMYDATGRLVK